MNIRYSERFKKSYKKLTKEERMVFQSKVRLFMADPMHPSLRVKKMQGTQALFEFSVNMDIRVVWTKAPGVILLLDIGHHSVLRKY